MIPQSVTLELGSFEVTEEITLTCCARPSFPFSSKLDQSNQQRRFKTILEETKTSITAV